ncbi:MAG: hypothetical protein K1X88_28555, partial [Nannocystaceae bacterium]|nr:hypothetical protein [Nannocystaceae bacterium]
TGSPAATTTAAAGSDSGDDDGRGKPGRPTRPVPPRSPPRTDCVVVLAGVPLPTAKNFKLHVTPADGTTAGTRTIDALELPLEFSGTEAKLSVSEAGWVGSRTVRRDECLRGAVTLQIRPKDAKLNFTFGGGTSKLVVTCTSGCPAELLGSDKMALNFPPIRFEPDTSKRSVNLSFKAEGYKPKSEAFELRPGANPIEVELEPRTSG